MLYVYQARMPIDVFDGMTQLKYYIKHYHLNSVYSFSSLPAFLISCFVAVKSCNTYWDGTINDDQIYISAIPAVAQLTSKIIAFKQYNDGPSYIVSEFRLPQEYVDDDEGFELMNPVNIRPEKLLEHFEESLDLLSDIMMIASEYDTNKEIKAAPFPQKLIKPESISEKNDQVSETVKIVSVNRPGVPLERDVNDKFNMENYQLV